MTDIVFVPIRYKAFVGLDHIKDVA
jgi:hypothetical protein